LAKAAGAASHWLKLLGDAYSLAEAAGAISYWLKLPGRHLIG